MHSFLSFYPIWINLVPNYKKSLIYYDKLSTKKKQHFWVSSGIQNDQNTPNSGEKAILVGVVPLKKTIIFLPFFFSKNIKFKEPFSTKFIQIG